MRQLVRVFGLVLSLACFIAVAPLAQAQQGPKIYVFTSGSLGGFPKAALQIGGKGEFCGFEYPATGQNYLPYMTKWVRSDQFLTLFVKAAHQPYLPDRVPWVVVLFALGQCKL